MEASNNNSASMSTNKPAVIGGEGVRHFAAGKIASFDLDLHGKSRDAVTVSITSPSKRQLSSRIVDGPSSQVHRVEFNPSEVGSYLIDISLDGLKIQGSPFVAKAFDSSLIRVSDVTNGAVGQPCQFRGTIVSSGCIRFLSFISTSNFNFLNSGCQSSWGGPARDIHQRR